MKHYKSSIKETDLIEFWKEKANLYSTKNMDLSDDDTISDYICNEYKDKFGLNKEDWEKMNRLIIANWFIQNWSFTPSGYKITEFKEVYEEIKSVSPI